MALTLKIEKQFAQNSERVKSVDFHPSEPWILTSLYSGTVNIWNYNLNTIEKSFKVTDSPVRSAKFITRKHWIIVASDDKFLRVYNYETQELVKEFEAHEDFIRCVIVHPTLPYVLSSSDDKLIKLWDWDKDWDCTQIFQGHTHYVMQVVFDPIHPTSFASASLDNSLKVWSIGSDSPSLTFSGHSKGVNCVDYFLDGEKVYLLSGSDDFTIKVWDFESKSCVETLEGHTHNVTSVRVHPELPIIVTGSEDGTVCIWNAANHRVENTLNFGFERVWDIGHIKGSHKVVFGCDKGTVVVEIEDEKKDLK